MIQDMDEMLAEMSRGNLTVDSKCEEAYVGGYRGLLDSARKLSAQLSDTLRQINQSADQVCSRGRAGYARPGPVPGSDGTGQRH